MTTERTVPLLPSLHTITGILRNTKRLRNSVNGNPRFQVSLEIPGVGQWLRWNTRTDSAVGGTVENFRLGTTVTLAINGQRAIIDMVNA